ncbi:hypothetical protein ACTID9_08030 [Brevibacillus fluminis]|nr:hypothetical protein [Brevibacillus fluminis]
MAKKKAPAAVEQAPEPKPLHGKHIKEMSPAWRLLYERIAAHAEKSKR